MRAVAVSAYGAVPRPMTVPRPVPGPGELLVRLFAAGLNPADWQIAEGALRDTAPASFPLVLGADGAGVVEQAGPGATRLRVGEPVYGCFSAVSRGIGSYAEYAVVAADGPVAPLPAALIYSQAAAVPTVAMAALNAVRAAGVDAGRTVLIVGATGGVGQAATQLAAARGAKVIATAGPDMAGELRRLGAAETVEYTAGDLVERVHGGVDIVLDFAGDADAAQRTARLLGPGGTYLSSRRAASLHVLEAHQIRGVNLVSEPGAALLEEVTALIEEDRLRVRVEAQVPLEEAPAALARNRAGGARGKTVIRI
ncbi:NADP-dependent oxidoreductase [Actinomadura macrotermitis]|uniref:L-threonine 3-dehydrogenase n=1 Tax=Actinomadura macrotermitis TaxID=2585200 RepID=A0A7K0BTG0_9ACTN|nr:NADP-dependent oxidoreductase [Actinomadura macrotermitis]MQY03984.1 L-threonine 3-dehydrogenase [Actinomadura macrotermitis]